MPLPGDLELDCRWRAGALCCGGVPLARVTRFKGGEANDAGLRSTVAFTVASGEERQCRSVSGPELEADVDVGRFQLDVNGLSAGSRVFREERSRGGIRSVPQSKFD